MKPSSKTFFYKIHDIESETLESETHSSNVKELHNISLINYLFQVKKNFFFKNKVKVDGIKILDVCLFWLLEDKKEGGRGGVLLYENRW